jgi:Family of unknown function (DUF6011)
MPTPRPHRLVDPTQIFKFVLGGNARFTLLSLRTQARYTYRIRKPDLTTPHFVSVLTGADNEVSYSFMGCILDKSVYRVARKSKVSADAPSHAAFMFFWGLLRSGKIHEKMEFWHEGRCCSCGRTLTVPSSIEAGIGPECAGKVQ